MAGREKTAREPISWPACKERLLMQHASDRKLLGAAKSVGIFLVTHLNQTTLTAWPSVEKAVQVLGYNRRTVQRALNLLVARGHWRIVEQGGGAGRTTVYAPIMWEPRDTKRAVKVPLFHSEQRAVALSQKGGRPVAKRAVKVPPEPYKEPEKEPSTTKAANFAPQGKASSSTPEPEKSSPAQRSIPMSDPGDKDRGALVRIVKTFHVSEENAHALIDGALGDLDPDELRAIIARAKASNFDRDRLQAAIGEAVAKRRAAPAAEARAKAWAKREAAEQRRQADAEAAHQAEHERRLAEDPVARLIDRHAAFIGKSRSLAVAEWMLWLPGPVEAAGEAVVDRWHVEAQERAPEWPLEYLRNRLAQWRETPQAPPAEADGPSAGEPKPDVEP